MISSKRKFYTRRQKQNKMIWHGLLAESPTRLRILNDARDAAVC
jgi:hypothetical protein